MHRIVSILCWVSWFFVTAFPEKIPLRAGATIESLKIILVMGFLVFGVHARVDELEKKINNAH